MRRLSKRNSQRINGVKKLINGSKMSPTIASRIWYLQVAQNQSDTFRAIYWFIGAIAGQIDRLTKIILINAVHFEGKWYQKFDTARTRLRPFYQTFGRKPLAVPMMRIYAPFRVAELPELDARCLELPYAVFFVFSYPTPIFFVSVSLRISLKCFLRDLRDFTGPFSFSFYLRHTTCAMWLWKWGSILSFEIAKLKTIPRKIFRT